MTSDSLKTRLLSCLFYGLASFAITVINKEILTSNKFPSYQTLGIGQMLATLFLLWIGRLFGWVRFSGKRSPFAIFPLPLIHLGNVALGLGGTQKLSLPMFTALRRFGIPMTMLLEYFIMDVRSSLKIKLSVGIMLFGALLAAADDPVLNPQGCLLVLASDLLTSLNGVILRYKLQSEELGEYGVMYYNCLFALSPAIIISWFSGDLERSLRYEGWNDAYFVCLFVLACTMGCILMYSVIMCTKINGALTTSIVGCLKNATVTYLGMVIGGDYIFTLVNFVGLNVSVLGSVLYTFVVFGAKRRVVEAEESIV